MIYVMKFLLNLPFCLMDTRESTASVGGRVLNQISAANHLQYFEDTSNTPERRTKHGVTSGNKALGGFQSSKIYTIETTR